RRSTRDSTAAVVCRLSPRSDQPLAQRDSDGGGAGWDLEFGEDVADVARDGARAEEEGVGDLPVGVPIGEETKHLGLAGGEERGRGRAVVGGGGFGEAVDGVGQFGGLGHRLLGGEESATVERRGEGIAIEAAPEKVEGSL